MLPIDIRPGTIEDATLIADFIRRMVAEMAFFGGHAVNDSPGVWSAMVERVQANSVRKEYLYLLASDGSPTRTTVGLAAAHLEPLDDIFVAKTRLHLSALYTVPSARRQGVARELLRKVLEWGRQLNVGEADLNVLVANPARRLYEQLGFQLHEISMVKQLVNDQPPLNEGARSLDPEAKSIPQISGERMTVNQGDIFWVTLEELNGAEADYTHPQVVIQANVLNQSRIHTVVVCALTSNLKRAKAPGNVLLEAGEANLPRQSVVVVSQVATVDKTQLGEYIGTLTEQRINQILAGMQFVQLLTEHHAPGEEK